ncbi:MAG TPA: acyl-CoA dehydrogenase [Acidimicrobiales bacterium]|nr:acyl-CoA dehydrogenase [Acidimicrobiales bacterium]
MRAGFDEEERALLEGFDETLRRLPEYATAVDDGRVDREVVSRLGRRLAADGWFEVADPRSDSRQPGTVLAGLAEVAGRRSVAIPYPLLETWLAVRVLRQAGAEEVATAVAAGERTATLAVDLLGGNHVGDTSGWVPYANAADLAVLVVAEGAETTVLLAELPLASMWEAPAIDLATPTGVAPLPVGREAGRLDSEELRFTRCLYLALQAAAMVGAADDLFRRTVDYLRAREQFGVRLSSFQALQHHAADLLVALEAARSLAYYAAWCADARAERMEEYALTAKGFCGETCWSIAGSAIQLHGGTGMTWEGALHYGLCRIAYLAMAGRNASECLSAAGGAAIDRASMLTLAHRRGP